MSTTLRLIESLTITKQLIQLVRSNKEYLKAQQKFNATALLTLPREASATYNARAALLRDIEKVQQNLKGIQDKQFRAQHAKIFAYTETLRTHRNSSAHDESVAHNEHCFDWEQVVRICDVILPDIEPNLDTALSVLNQQVTAPSSAGP